MTQRSQKRWRWWREALLAIAFAVAPYPTVAGDTVPDPVKLANLVRQDCGSCHGLTLKGGLGKPLTADRMTQWDRSQIVHIILDGVPGTPMPPWRPLLSEADARWIADSLKEGSLR
jgi:cytochrome c55X